MRARIVVRLMLLFAAFSVLSQAQVVLTDDANTSSLTPKTNYGGSIALIVCSGSNTYIKFSFANLPAGINGANISGANVVLYVDAVLTSGTMDVYAVNGPWSESTITYNNAPSLGNKLLSAVPVTKSGYLSLNLTSTVQTWLNGTLTNNGIALVPSSGSSIAVSFDSKENILTSHTAQLPLVLVSAGPQGPQGPQGSAGAAGPAGPVGATGPTGPAGQQGPQGLMGLTGMTGATGPAGPAGANGIGFNFRSAFDNSASYAVNDVVTFQGASYVAITANQGSNNPTPDQNSAWSLMAQSGAPGAAGATGSQGPAGAPGATGAQGPAGPQGPLGPQGPAGSGGGGGFNGILEFTQSGTFTVPAGVSTIQVELWGAGGGGDCYGNSSGGGSGGYTRAILSVTPGTTYNVLLGAGGISGFLYLDLYSNVQCQPTGDAGTAGGASQITDSSSNVLASAGGGSGGMACNGSGSLGGLGGSGTNTIGRHGNSGVCAPVSTQIVGVFAAGGVAPLGTIQPPSGSVLGGTAGKPASGGPGYALVSW